MHLTYRYRIKDATCAKHLRRLAGSANFVWNYLCGVQREAEKRRYGDKRCRWPTTFDLIKLTQCGGVAAELGLHSDTIAAICRQFIKSRDAVQHCPRYRSRRRGSLGWLPFIARAIKVDGPRLRYLGRYFHFWKSRELGGEIVCGSLKEDARGRWYVNFVCEVAETKRCGAASVGIDLGLKQFAARKHFLHEHSTALVREFETIVVGNVNAKALMRTRLAKSVGDASWSAFRDMLAYKAFKHRACFIEANERMTTQTCSDCGAIGGPKGIAGLRMRTWVCSSCGAVHDRDTNAALNLLSGAERRPPVVGIPCLLAEGRR